MTIKLVSDKRIVRGMFAAATLGLFSMGIASGSDAAVVRTYTAGRFSVELGGRPAGAVIEFAGGNATADVIKESAGPDKLSKKHLGNVRYEEITIASGTGMSKAYYEWIKQSINRTYVRQDGAIIAGDFNDREVSRLTFTKALITTVEFPAVDGSFKDSLKLLTTLAPEQTRFRTTANGAATNHASAMAGHGKWMGANFRLRIDGLDDATSRANHVEPIGVRVKATQTSVGEMRDFEKEPGEIAYGNLVFTVPEAHAEKLRTWYDDFVVKGNAGDANEKSGTLEYLAPDLKTVFFRLTFNHLGIFRLSPVGAHPNEPTVARVKAELYMESLTFDYPNAGTP